MYRLIAVIFIAACLANTQPALAAPGGGTQPAGEDRAEDIGEGFSTEMLSGPESRMPWIVESRFEEAVARNKTYVMLGGYKTVLKDPLPGEEYNVHLAAEMLAGIVVKPGSIFSEYGHRPVYREQGFQGRPDICGDDGDDHGGRRRVQSRIDFV